MKNYSRKIKEIISYAGSRDIIYIFGSLLTDYLNESSSIFTSRHHQSFIQKLLSILNDPNPAINQAERWRRVADYLNSHLPIVRLNADGDFAQLLKAFLIISHPLLKHVNADLLKHLSLRRYSEIAPPPPRQPQLPLPLPQPALPVAPQTNNNIIVNAIVPLAIQTRPPIRNLIAVPLLIDLSISMKNVDINEESFLNLMRTSTPRKIASMLPEIERFLTNVNPDGKLRIAQVLAKTKTLLPNVFVEKILTILCDMHEKHVMSLEQRLSLTTIFSLFADNITIGMHDTFVSLFKMKIKIKTKEENDRYHQMLVNLNATLETLQSKAAPIYTYQFYKFIYALKPTIVHLMQRANAALSNSQAYTMTLWNTLVIVSSHEEEFVIDITKVQFAKSWHYGTINAFIKATKKFTGNKRQDAIQLLSTIFDLNSPHEKANWDDRIALLELQHDELPDEARNPFIENMITYPIRANVIPNWRYCELIGKLVGHKQPDGLEHLANYLLECLLKSDNALDIDCLVKILSIAINNEQVEIPKRFFEKLTRKNEIIIDDFIYIFIHLENRLNAATIDTFVERIGRLILLKNTYNKSKNEIDKYKNEKDIYIIIDKLGEIASPYAVRKLSIMLQQTVALNLKLASRLNVKSLALIKSATTAAQHKMIYNLLSVTGDSALRYQKECVFIEYFSDVKRDNSFLQMHLLLDSEDKENSDTYRGYVNAMAACANTTDDPQYLKSIFSSIVIDCLTNPNFPGVDFLEKILPQLSSEKQLQFANHLCQKYLKLETDSTDKPKVYFCLVSLLKIFPHASPAHAMIMEIVIANADRQLSNLSINILIDELHKLMLSHSRLAGILHTLIIEKSQNHLSLIKLAVATQNSDLIQKIVAKSVTNLSLQVGITPTYKNTYKNLVILLPFFTKDTRESLAELSYNLLAYSGMLNAERPAFKNWRYFDCIMNSKNIALFSALATTSHIREVMVNLLNLCQFDHLAPQRIPTDFLKAQLLTRFAEFFPSIMSALIAENINILLTQATSDIKIVAANMLRKTRTVLPTFSFDQALQNTVAALPPEAIADTISLLTNLINNECVTMKLIGSKGLCDLFALVELPNKEIILKNLTGALINGNTLVNQPRTKEVFRKLASQISNLKVSQSLKLIIKDAYHASLASSPQRLSESSMILLHMSTSMIYVSHISFWINKKIQSPDITQHIMRFMF